MQKLTEKIQHLPAEQAHQLLLQHLLRHLAVLTHHLLLILATTNTNRLPVSPHIQFERGLNN